MARRLHIILVYSYVCIQIGCLIVLFCKEYNVDSTKVMEAIVSRDTESTADISTEVYNHV